MKRRCEQSPGGKRDRDLDSLLGPGYLPCSTEGARVGTPELSFEDWFGSVTRPDGGARRLPYDYQRRLAEDGLPDVLHVPTGAGETLAVLLAWLWRLLHHSHEAVRRTTPPWLVYVLPMRVLVEQDPPVLEAMATDGASSEANRGALARSKQRRST
jgi:hypothetical protein